MDHSSTSSRPFKYANLVEVLQYTIATFLPWFLGSILSLVVFPNFFTKGGSQVWHHIAKSWKLMAQMVTYLSPFVLEDVLQLNLWWQMEYQGLYFDIIRDRALIIYIKVLEILPGYMGAWKE
jgi:hypothetical protein